MKAIVRTKYGPPDVLKLEEVPKPTMGDDDVLIKIHAAALNAADLHLLTADVFLVRLMAGGLFKPKHKILGADVAGRVEAVGKNVKQFKPGDEVFGDIFKWGFGGLAEYACVSEDALVLKPTNLSFEEAAAVPLAALTALHGLRDKGQIKPEQKVLINGASGGVGTYAVQIAKYFGAEVTAVTSTSKMEMVRSLGADYLIDYTKEDFTKSGQLYDLILAINGYHPIWDYKRALSPKGTYVMCGGRIAQMFQAILLGRLISIGSSKKMAVLSSEPSRTDLAFMKELIESGKVKPVIDKRYSLSDAPEAFRYLQQGHARGKVVITIEQATA